MDLQSYAPIPQESAEDPEPTPTRRLGKRMPLTEIAGLINLAPHLSDTELHRIGELVVREYELDVASRQGWLKKNQDILRLARMWSEREGSPVSDSPGGDFKSDVKYPEIAKMAVQIGTRAYSQLIAKDPLVRTRLHGQADDVKKARMLRVQQHMNYQLTIGIPGYRTQERRRLPVTILSGNTFAKTFWDNEINGPRVTMILPEDLVFNYYEKDFHELRRITHVFGEYRNQIIEKQRRGIYRDFDPEQQLGDGSADEYVNRPPDDPEHHPSVEDSHKPYVILEQHTWLDLDQDGYDEPYIVTVHHATREVIRIVARFHPEDITYGEDGRVLRIQEIRYFDAFECLPPLDGSCYGIGVGTLMHHPVLAINALINLLIESGKRANGMGGITDGRLSFPGMDGQEVEIDPGAWNVVHTAGGGGLSEHVYQFKFPEPSPVLFEMAKLLIEASREIGASANILSGNEPHANTPASTTLALIEQALQMMTSIFEGLHETYTSIYRKIFALNTRYLRSGEGEQSFLYGDQWKVVYATDYDNDGLLDITPVSDPRNSTSAQKIMRAEAIMNLPLVPVRQKVKLYLEALEVENIEELLPPEGQEPIDPKLQIEMAKIEMEKARIELDFRRLQMDEQKMAAELAKNAAEIKRINADALLKIAQAEAAEAGTQNDQYAADLEDLGRRTEELQSLNELLMQQRIQLMERLRDQAQPPAANEPAAGPATPAERPSPPEGLQPNGAPPMGPAPADPGSAAPPATPAPPVADGAGAGLV